MKKIGRFFLLAVLWCLACTRQYDYRIEGEIADVADGAEIGLFETRGNLLFQIGKTTVSDGRFVFEGALKDSAARKLDIIGLSEGFPNISCEVWVGPGVTEITGRTKLLATWRIVNDVPGQRELNRYVAATRTDRDSVQRIRIEQMELQNKANGMTGRQIDSLTRIYNTLEERADSLEHNIAAVELEIMKGRPVSTVWLDKLQGLALQLTYDERLPRDEVEALYARLDSATLGTERGQNITNMLFPPQKREVGDDMADAVLFDPDGASHRLFEYKGKYLLLCFWSVGSAPCVNAIPEMQRVERKYSGQLTIIPISMDTQEEVWLQALKSMDGNWVNLNDFKGINGRVPSMYGVRRIPHYVLISPEGKILDVWSGYSDNLINSKVDNYLND